MASRGRPPGREYTVKVEVWVSQRQCDELDAFCELHHGVKRAEILRRSLVAYLKANTETATKKAEFEKALRDVRSKRSSENIRPGLRSIPGLTNVTHPEDQRPT